MANFWLLLVDLEVIPTGRAWAPTAIVYLVVLLIPLAAVWQLASGEPTRLFALLAPLLGLFLLAAFYSFDVYGEPPYQRNSEASDMPAAVVYVAVAGAMYTGVYTWYRGRPGVVLTVAACFGLSVLIFFSHVFH